MLSVSGDMVDRSNMYLEAGNASKSRFYSQCLIQSYAHNRCAVVSVEWMLAWRTPLELWFRETRLIWYQPQLVFHQAFTLWSWVWGKIFNCGISGSTIRQRVCLHRFDCTCIFCFRSQDGQYSQPWIQRIGCSYLADISSFLLRAKFVLFGSGLASS